MKIRGKVLCAIGFALLATALANFFVLKTLVFPTFLDLEQQAAARDVQRIKEALNAEIEDVDKTLWDYSSWDDSYRFAKGGDKSYPSTNLGVESLQTLRLDIVEIYNTKKVQLFSAVFNRRSGQVRHADWTLALLADGDELRIYADDASRITGIMRTPELPVLVASRPIVKTNREGPAVGSLLFGRFVDDELLADIKDRIKVDFTLTPVEELSGPTAGAYQQLLASGASVQTERSSNDRLLAYSLISDLQERPILLVTAKVKRDLSQIGERVLLASVGGLAVTAILVTAVLAILLQWLLVGPLVNLTRHIVEIQAEGAPSRRVALARGDEIGILSREFDHMLARLAEARDRLLDHSYQSGVAHMASGVLHNLRNQLNEKESELRHKVKEKEQLEHLLAEIKDRLNELKLQLAGMKERLHVAFRIDLDDILEEDRTTDTPVEELQEKADRMKKRLENLGEVNPTAIEAFTEMKKRYDFIVEQKTDLVNAKDSLLKTIEEVEATANQKFLDTFHLVRDNFQKVFKTLFTEDDQADLVLENPENIAETGIDVVAKPKGKRPSSLTQLSGGERTLTATALLFAIYLIKPAPFCILDEVDAPLDDANVGKFTNMIRQFSDNSQFIIVTHNKMTMSTVDVIYGVTMQEPGVSKLVPVDFRNLQQNQN